ncbi:hypothetical protein B0H13DRAFT_2109738 [Mycena leptocephala]|nr:hypothetical protein B0H13DRAFT_2109738 [Mycena leptocephala]
MIRFNKKTFVTAVALASCAPGVLPYTITGQSTFQFNGPVTLTWTSDATDPVLFQIDIDELLNSLESTDPYFVLQNVTTALGSTTFTPNPILSVGTHRIAFSSTDSFTVYTTGSIEILAPATSSSSSSPPPPPPPPTTTTTTTPPTTSSTPASPPPTSSAPPSLPPSSSDAASSKSASISSLPSSSNSSSTAPISSISQTGSSTQSQTALTQSQSPIGAPQVDTTKKHSSTGAIAGGIVAAAVILIFLALLGWWYLRRRNRSPIALGQTDDSRFVSTPFLSTVAVAGAGTRSDHDEFRPWEENLNQSSTALSAPTPTSASPTTTSPPPSGKIIQTPHSRVYPLITLIPLQQRLAPLPPTPPQHPWSPIARG